MAIERVRAQKMETTSHGGNRVDQVTSEVDPQSEYYDALGYAVQRNGTDDGSVYVSRSTDDQLAFTDVVNGTVKLATLLASTQGITALTGDVAAAGPGSSAANVNAVGGQNKIDIAQVVAALKGSFAQSYVAAAPTSGNGPLAPRLLVAADIPNLPYAQITGLQPSAYTDTTNATNITTGTLPSARLSGGYAGITAVGTLTAGAVPVSLLSPGSATAGQVPTYSGSAVAWATPTAYLNALTGDVAASGSGSQPATVNKVGGSFAQDVNQVTAALKGAFAQNLVVASPNGSSGALVPRALVAADVPTLPYSQISGLQPSAYTDTTNATNISSGTLPTGRLAGGYTGITAVGALTAGTIPPALIDPTGATSGQVLKYNGTSVVFAAATAATTFPLNGSAGSASAPTYSFNGGGTGAGMYYDSGSDVGFAYGGNPVFTYNASGIVCQSTTQSNQFKSSNYFQVTGGGNATTPAFIVGSSSASGMYGSNSALNFCVGSTQVSGYTTSAVSWLVKGTFAAGFAVNGSTSGAVSFVAPATVTSYSLTLPAAQGGASTVLSNDGSGNLSWVAQSGGSGTVSYPLQATDGTAASPSYSFASATGTGLYNKNGNIALASGGADSLYVSSGFLFHPLRNIAPQSTASAPGWAFINGGATGMFSSANTNVGLAVAGAAVLNATGTGVAFPVGVTALPLNGSTSGILTLNAAASTNSYALSLPAAQGAANQTLVNDGSGNLTWATPAASSAVTYPLLANNGSVSAPSYSFANYTSTGVYAGAGSSGGTSLYVAAAGVQIAEFNNTSGLGFFLINSDIKSAVGRIISGYNASSAGSPSCAIGGNSNYGMWGNSSATGGTGTTNLCAAGATFLSGTSSSLSLPFATTFGTSLSLLGSTSGSALTLKAAAAQAAYTITLPAAAPTATGQTFIADTSGNLTWGAPAATGTVNNVVSTVPQRDTTGSLFYSQQITQVASAGTVSPVFTNSNGEYQFTGASGTMTVQLYTPATNNQYPIVRASLVSASATPTITVNPQNNGYTYYPGGNTAGTLTSKSTNAAIKLTAQPQNGSSVANWTVESMLGVWYDNVSGQYVTSAFAADQVFSGVATVQNTINTLVMRPTSASGAVNLPTINVNGFLQGTKSVQLNNLSAAPAAAAGYAQWYNTSDFLPHYQDSQGNNYTVLTSSGLTTHVAPAGTNAAPGVTFLGNTNSGMYIDASSNLAFSYAGTERLSLSNTVNCLVPVSVTGSLTTTTSISGGTAVYATTFFNCSASGTATACAVQLQTANTGLYYPTTGQLAISAGGTQAALFSATSASFPNATSVSFASATTINMGAAVASFSSTAGSIQFPIGSTAITATTDTSQGLVLASNFMRLNGPGGALGVNIGNQSSFYGVGIGLNPLTTAYNALAIAGALATQETTQPATLSGFTHVFANSTDHHLYASNPTYGQVALTNGGVPVAKATTAATTTVTLANGDNGRTWMLDGTYAGTSTINLPASSTTTDQTFKVMQSQATYGGVVTAAASTNIQFDTVPGSTAGSVTWNALGSGFALFLPKGKTTWQLLYSTGAASGTYTIS